MQQGFPEHLLCVQPQDQHLEEDMNELHCWPLRAHSPARKNSHVNGSLEYPVVSAKNRGVSPIGRGHMCHNDSPCMVGRVGFKCLSGEFIAYGDILNNPPERATNWGWGYLWAHASFAERPWKHPLWTLRSPLIARGPPSVGKESTVSGSRSYSRRLMDREKFAVLNSPPILSIT